jgi:two-component system sensor histidine kinase UhpB
LTPERRTGVRRALDAALILLVLGTFIRWGEADVLLDAAWVVLAVGAFVFEFPLTILRIVLVMVVKLAYIAVMALSHGQVLELDLFELTEWPLVVVISVIVALMADRVSGMARRYATMYRDASERLMRANEDARARLARDIHDGVGQTLTASLLTIESASASLDRAGSGRRSNPAMAEARASLAQARSLVAAALEEAHDVAAQLRPLRINEIGLGAAIKALAGSAGTRIDLRFAATKLPPGLLEPDRQVDIFRIVQEALGNATAHSQAQHIWIRAKVDPENVRVEVGDDGVGFERPAEPTGLGLMSMEERASNLGGRLEVQSIKGVGTTVILIVPRAKPGLDAPRLAKVPLAAHGGEATV